ncbi:Restriction of telomere capping protein 5 [Smittium culicis]|uniref:Restriction of telomere capping protein 5 n=1 Tax=Smittium culicis TaxID=133412 RepID=A0A1R1Y1Z1_9FUNG|nr:Restriction of telomere capping protein 5 [Smittium culicis]
MGIFLSTPDSSKSENVNIATNPLTPASLGPTKKSSKSLDSNSKHSFESSYQNYEINSFYNFINKISKLQNKNIDIHTFKKLLSLPSNNKLECFKWLENILFFSFYCLKEYHSGAELGKAHLNLGLNSVSSDLDKISSTIILTKQDVLVSLSVFLFDRCLPSNFYINTKYSQNNDVTYQDLWDLRISLIVHSILEAHNFYYNDCILPNNNDLEPVINTTENFQEISQQEVGNLNEIGVDEVKIESEFSMDSFLELLDKNISENPNSLCQQDNLFISKKPLALMLQSFFMLIKLEDIDKNCNEIPLKTEYVNEINLSLRYIEEYVNNSLQICFQKKFKVSFSDDSNISLDDVLDWIQYIGDGLFNNIFSFLSNRFLNIPNLMMMKQDYNFNSYKYFGSNKLNPLLDHPSSLLNDTSLFLLSIKANPFGKKWNSFSDSRCNSVNIPRRNSQKISHQLSSSLSPLSLFSLPRSNDCPKSGENTTDDTDLDNESHPLSEFLMWSKLFNTTYDGFGMSVFLSSVIHYDAPTILIISGKVSDPPNNHHSHRPFFNFFDSLLSIPSIPHSTIPEDTFPILPGDNIKLGVFVSTSWTESKKTSFGDKFSFIFLIEPYFQILAANEETQKDSPLKSYTLSDNAFSSYSGVSINTKDNEPDKPRYASCYSSLGIQFGGLGFNRSVTSSRISSSVISSSVIKPNPSLVIDLSSEFASLINDPFSKPPNPAYNLISPYVPFRVDIDIDEVELFGLGGDTASSNQEKLKSFDEMDARRRRSINSKVLNKSSHIESHMETSKWILEASGLLPSKK